MPTKNSLICSVHFHSHEFVETTLDTNKQRKKNKGALSKRYLKPATVPSIFPNAPSYLSTIKPKPRCSAATSAQRFERENIVLQEKIVTFCASDSICNDDFHTVLQRLNAEKGRPTGYHVTIEENSLCIYMLEIKPSFHISCYICLAEDRRVSIGVSGVPVKSTRFADLLTNGKVTTLSQLVNIMSRVKHWRIENSAKASSTDDACASRLIDMAEDLLEAAETLVKSPTVGFVSEQLKLSRQPSSNRRYSQQLLILAYLIYSTSPSAYKAMLDQDALCLPSDRTLRFITAKVGSTKGLDSEQYLQLRASKLSQMEKTVTLVIDEIYIARRIEYSSGQLTGLDEDGAIASTLCCFMVNSVAGPFKDMVAMHAVTTLTAKKLSDWFKQVMDLLRSLNFTVVAICIDNAAVNRKFAKELCGNILSPFLLMK